MRLRLPTSLDTMGQILADLNGVPESSNLARSVRRIASQFDVQCLRQSQRSDDGDRTTETDESRMPDDLREFMSALANQ